MTTHMIGQTVGQLWDNIKDKFVQDDEGRWYNERLEEEKSKRKKFVKSRNNNLSGKNQYTKQEEKQSGHMGGHMTNHMENENEDVNVNTIKGGYGGKSNDVEIFVETVNSILNRSYKPLDKLRPKVKNILKEYNIDEIGKAVKNAKGDKFHQENNHKHLTPEFFTRSDKVDMWLNAKNGSHKQIEEHGANIPRLDKYANKL